ncbi:hypothetical protein KVR01_005731 [Diaporthe batatas]|uniref:uncharacterized protein n=1 Tax=Diaporthe batatas TaxID=748121 RepID=UPI001D036FD5|nr:uncharacterized protein KVR01_005731 [Diaporthe batatas]KAG8163813.1 hypothetical protein KVR01_005731 [Diaporthe batatas]
MADSSSTSSGPINCGQGDCSPKACWHNCGEGECCDCDHHPKSDTSEGQRTPSLASGYQPLPSQESLQSVDSGGQGPSQPRNIPKQQQYRSAEPMKYGTGGEGQDETHSGSAAPHQGYGTLGTGTEDMRIARRYPSGFTSQASTFNSQQGANINAYETSKGYYRNAAGQLCNGQGQPINEITYQTLLQPGPSSIQQSSTPSEVSDKSFKTAPSHRCGSSDDAA